MSRKPLLLAWRGGNNFGWGVVGLNIFYQWAMADDVEPLMAYPIQDVELTGEAPDRTRRYVTALLSSNIFAAKLGAFPGTARVDMPVVHALGNKFASERKVAGARNIARAVFEDTDFAKALPVMARYEAVVCASSWNAALLRDKVRAPVQVIHETTDHARFFPAPKLGLLSPDRFHIFTGGKIEFRKAQDLVLLAFREFSRKHDDAVLVASWRSPWPELSMGFQGRLDTPLGLTVDGDLDVTRWLADNGVDPGKVIELGSVPNAVMPRFLREMDCALQPSRAEGASNMVAMEAMSCGVPTILARNTGVVDIVTADNCIALERQSPVSGEPSGGGTEGWGESDVEEIVAALERLYVSWELRAKVGAAGAAFMRTRTWADHAEALKTLVLSTI